MRVPFMYGAVIVTYEVEDRRVVVSEVVDTRKQEGRRKPHSFINAQTTDSVRCSLGLKFRCYFLSDSPELNVDSIQLIIQPVFGSGREARWAVKRW